MNGEVFYRTLAVLWAVSLKDMAKAVAKKKKPVKMVAKKAVKKAPAPKKATKKNPKKAVKKVAATAQKRQNSAADLPPGPKVGGSHSLGPWQSHCPQCCTLAVC